MNAFHDTPSHSADRLVSWVIGGVALVMGCMVLADCFFGISAAGCWFPQVMSIKANTAVAFILSGVALFLMHLPGRRARHAMRICALMVGALASLTLAEHVGALNCGIDEWVSRDPGAASGSPHPGRMALNSAVGFVLFAAALWLMGGTRWTARRISLLMVLGVLVGTTGLTALLGYLAGIRVGYSWWGPTVMSVYAAPLFILFGVEVLRFAWRKADMRWWIGTERTAGFACGLVLLVGVGIYSYRTTTDLVDAAEWVKHTHEVIGKLAELRSSMDESQSGMRGYVITGDSSFLALSERSDPAARKTLAELRDLRELTVDNPSQQARLSQLGKWVPEQLDVSQAVIRMWRAAAVDPEAQTAAVHREKALMDPILACLTAMRNEEVRLLAVRDARTETIIDRTFAILPAGLLLSLLLLGASILRLNGEIGERQHGAEILANERNLLRTLIDLLPTLIYVKDRDSRFLVANFACANFMGAAKPEDLIGKTDADFYPADAARNFRAEELPVLDGIALVGKEQPSSHSPQVLLTTKVPLRGGDGKIIGLVGASFDISERKQAEDEIRQLNTTLDQRVRERTAQLETVIKELDAFSYSVSHDLRAPLRAVDGFSRILAEDCAPQLGADGLRMLGVIRGETQRMGQLIDDLLAFSRLGRQQIEPVSIDMRTLAREVFDELAARDGGRGLRLDLGPLPSALGSLAMIRQVWVNLIGNAIKFTQPRELGEIEIGTQEGDADGAVYYVKDNGAGFDMRYEEKLFGVFQRLHTQQEFPGTGVGLALVKRIVQRHGGRVWAEGQVGKGAVFYFTLPHPPP